MSKNGNLIENGRKYGNLIEIDTFDHWGDWAVVSGMAISLRMAENMAISLRMAPRIIWQSHLKNYVVVTSLKMRLPSLRFARLATPQSKNCCR